MVLVCKKCQKPNPDHARFCHFDGQNLTGIGPLPPPPPRPPPRSIHWAVVVATACLLFLLVGYFSKLLAIVLVAMSVGFAVWRLHRSQVWRQPNWWRFRREPPPKALSWTAGSLLGLGASFGIGALTSGPAPVVANAGDAEKPVIAANLNGADNANGDSPAAPSTTAPKVETVRLADPNSPPDAPVRSCLIESSLMVASSAAAESDSSGALTAVDGNRETAWLASGAGDSWLELRFDRSYEIDGIVVANGGAGGGFIRSARLEFDGGAKHAIELERTADWRLVPLPRTGADSLRLVVLSVYEGAPAARGGLSEIWVCHRAGLAPGTADWSGRWEMAELGGDLTIEQKDDWLFGSYFDGAGSLIGRATARRAIASWYMDDFGEVELQISPGESSFTGKWKSGMGGVWNEDSIWSGERR